MLKIDVNELPGVEEWMKKRSAYYFRGVVMTSVMLLVLGVLFLTGATNTENLADNIFLAFFFGFVLFFDIQTFRMWRRNRERKVSAYWFGVVTDMQCTWDPNREVRYYRITADVNGQVMEGSCLLSTYRRVEIGGRILLFKLDGCSKIFCVCPDE